MSSEPTSSCKRREIESFTLCWHHVRTDEDDDGWNVLESKPSHPLRPVLRITRTKNDDAEVLITCREKDDDTKFVVANVIVPWRFDLWNCSICEGSGFQGEVVCPWCKGHERTAMDETREIACALYWSWLRSPNGGSIAVSSATKPPT